MLIDPFKRKISYIRISVTDRCDFRCTYCMPEKMQFLPKKDLLTLEELERLGNVFIDLGVKKLRITGGEPLVRKDIMNLFKGIGKRIGNGLEELTLTTNGSQLEDYADELFEIGVRRIDINKGWNTDLYLRGFTIRDKSLYSKKQINCQRPHYYDLEDIYPLKKTIFEDIEVFVPNNVSKVLIQEYGKKVLLPQYKEWTFTGKTWIKYY